MSEHPIEDLFICGGMQALDHAAGTTLTNMRTWINHYQEGRKTLAEMQLFLLQGMADVLRIEEFKEQQRARR